MSINLPKQKIIIKIFLITTILFSFLYQAPKTHAQTVNGTTYTIYGGNNLYDTISLDWTAGSDNVVWDFGQKEIVYRLTKSLSLKYNPNGEFHVIKTSPLDISLYKYLSFVGRTDEKGLDFGVTLINSNNQPISNTLRFATFGGEPATNYWTQYNFPLTAFNLNSNEISGIKINQFSNGWFSTIFLDEIYISDLRGEEINPIYPTITPTPEPSVIDKLEYGHIPQINPAFIFLPIVIIAFALLFH